MSKVFNAIRDMTPRSAPDPRHPAFDEDFEEMLDTIGESETHRVPMFSVEAANRERLAKLAAQTVCPSSRRKNSQGIQQHAHFDPAFLSA